MQTQKSLALNPIQLFLYERGRIPVPFRDESAKFSAKVQLNFDRSGFVVKTAETHEELEKVLQLRYEIFHREFKGSFLPYGIDFEPLDTLADHLLVIHKDSNAIVGTYRLLASNYARQFYSESEFHLKDFLSSPGVKLEMSRAGIRKDHRNGITMALLWRGVSEYMKKVNAEYIFGCASVKTWSPASIQRIVRELTQRKCVANPFHISPKEEYREPEREPFFKEKVVASVPALMSGYLKAGAKVVPEAAWDRDFRCVDFLTILKVSEMDQVFERRYIQKKSET